MKRAAHEKIQVGEITAADWITTVHGATSAAEVVKLCAGFISLWGPGLRAKLPESCLPPLALKGDSQVSSYAFLLVRERLRTKPSVELDALATFFSAAATRLAQLLAAPRGGVASPFFHALRDIEHEE